MSDLTAHTAGTHISQARSLSLARRWNEIVPYQNPRKGEEFIRSVHQKMAEQILSCSSFPQEAADAVERLIGPKEGWITKFTKIDDANFIEFPEYFGTPVIEYFVDHQLINPQSNQYSALFDVLKKLAKWPLEWSIRVIEKLLQQGADINEQHPYDPCIGSHHLTPLEYCVRRIQNTFGKERNLYMEMLHFILQHGADPMLADTYEGGISILDRLRYDQIRCSRCPPSL